MNKNNSSTDNFARDSYMNASEYKKLLICFLDKGFIFTKFESFCSNKEGQLILRHDVDFCIDKALKMATIEKNIGVCSTYYFLLSSDSYNVLSKKNSSSIKKIKDMGHTIGLHFDPTVYVEEKKGFYAELELFERSFGTVQTMSFHRPAQLVLEGVDWLPDRILGAYQDQFLKKIAYVSDSQGEFRFGHPINHTAFKQCQNMQLLIHPIWWITDEYNAVEKIKAFLSSNKKAMSDHIAGNCKPWKKYNE